MADVASSSDQSRESVIQNLAAANFHIEATDFDLASALFWAVKNGHEAEVDLLVEKGPQINAVDQGNARTALHWAAQNGNVKILQLVLSKNPELEIKDKDGYTALHIAAKQGDLEDMVRQLLGHGAEIEATDRENGRTALQWAVWAGNIKIVKLLLRRKPMVESRDRYGNNALHLAAQHNRATISALLVDHGADIEAIDEASGRTALHWAVRKDNIKTVGVLLEKRPDLDYKDKFGNTALHLAIIRAVDAQIVHLLMEKGSKPEIRDRLGKTALHLAAGEPKDLEEIIKFLLAKDANKQAIDGADGRTAIHIAVRKANIKVVKLLLEGKPSLEKKDKYGYTALHLAARQSQDLGEIVLLLINNGADIEATDEKGGRTALQWAVRNGNAKLVALLLERHPKLEIKDKVNEDTALHLAARQPQDLEAIVQLLLKGGAKTEAISGDGGCTALHLAVRNRNVKVVRLLLAKNANIEAVMKKGKTTALHLAAIAGDENIIQALLDKDAKLHVKDGDGNTALHRVAQQEKNLEKALKLLLGGSDIETTNRTDDRTPLQLAVRSKNITAIRLLLDAKPKIDRKDRHGYTALHLAARQEQNPDDITTLLLNHGASITAADRDCHRTALQLAVRNGNVNTVKLLLGRGAHVDQRDKFQFTALHLAARYPQDQESITRLLLDNGADIEAIDDDGYTALHLAVQSKNVKDVRVLLHEGADVNLKRKKKTTALHLAASLGNEVMMQALLGKDPKLEVKDENGCTALHRAVQRPQDLEEVVRLLLDKGADIEATDGSNSRTALHMAVQSGHVKVTRLLLERKAQLKKFDKDGYTVLHLAVQQPQDLILQSLLKEGVDIKATSGREGRTALHMAVSTGNIKAVQLLLEWKANLAEKDKNGQTALLLAARQSQDTEEMAKLLIDSGADIEATDGDEGRTALHLAAQHGHEQMVKLLLQKGADITAIDMGGQSALDLTPESNSAVRALLENPSPIGESQLHPQPVVLEPSPKSGETLFNTNDLQFSLGSALERPGTASSQKSHLSDHGQDSFSLPRDSNLTHSPRTPRSPPPKAAKQNSWDCQEIRLHCGGIEAPAIALLDTGSEFDWVTLSLIERLERHSSNDEPVVESITGGNHPTFTDSSGNEFQPSGMVIGSWFMPGYNRHRMYDSNFYVNNVNTTYEVLIGRNTIAAVGILVFSPRRGPVLPLIHKPRTQVMQTKINEGVALQEALIRADED